MISQLFLGFTLLGSQWVLWFLFLLSIVSFALIFERLAYFKKALPQFSQELNLKLKALPNSERQMKGSFIAESFLAETRLKAENRLSYLATIGSNAPFVGLFGTVLGIIRAFHDLSQSGTQGSSMVSAGISEALVATAVGLFVAIPAVVAYNFFQRKVKDLILISDQIKNGILGE